MALPTSGNLSLSQVRTEFGAPVATPLSAFLRSGSWVPNSTANAGVPTALPISLRQLLGASAQLVSLSGGWFGALNFSPSNANISYSIVSSGTVTVARNSDPASTFETWLISGVGSDYEVRFTVQSGSITGVTAGTWLVLSSTRSVSLSRSETGQSIATVLVELRTVGGAVLDSATITLSASVEAQ